ncbi:PIR Superfamily Protein [Plasmodium ovale wallikeri]|uniref:PIR Superfamily Protein n=1 Tax=Plasmodium ovale wallikeri TaxID=864142 RepID=A0A1A9APG4_PLAOA|nr:PIR Superfamily Protein [Plasmodium ovale wallikeri]SBT58087.1 PIR Superfamily Protein [Plasmodium ovale wallikeri]
MWNGKPEKGLQILRYLENNTVWSDKDSGYDVCILLNYWIYDELIHIFVAEITSEKINSAFDILQMIWKHPIEKLERTNYYQKCTPNMNIYNYEDWKERRNLYEYYSNFDTLSKTAQRYDNACEAYYKKIEGTKSLYKYFENKGQELGHGSSPYDTDPTSERSDIGAKVGHSVLGVAPVLLTATALYRVGGINTNGIGDVDEFSSYTQESGDMFLGDTGNYISYQTM